MNRLPLLLLLFAPLTLGAQQAAAPHDSLRGAIRAVDVGARTVDIASGVGLALSVMRLQVPVDVPITDRAGAQPPTIELAALKPGDVIRATYGGRPGALVAYTIVRVGRLESTP